jgi:basic membrane lipoprotein Med (substrate-binding protein (PBP1-ABC) superfamily)
MGDGADVIFGAGGPTGSGGIQEAAQNDVWVIGVDQDEWVTTFGGGESPGSEFIFTSALKRVDIGVYDMIAALVNGEGFVGGGNYILDVNNGGITFAEAHEAEVPAEVYEAAAEVQTLLAEGTISTGVDPAGGEITDEIAAILEGADLGDFALPE